MMRVGPEWIDDTVDNIPVFTASGWLRDSGTSIRDLIVGPESSIQNNIPLFKDLTGKSLRDSGISIDSLVIGPAKSTNRHLVFFDGESGKKLVDGGVAISDIITGPHNSVDGNFPVFNGPGGNALKDSGKSIVWLQTALDGKAAANHPHVIADVTGLQAVIDGKASVSHTHTPAGIGTVTLADVDARIKTVVGAAPAALDTLKELADAFGNDANFAGKVTTQLAGKAAVKHTHVIADVPDLQTALNDKSAASHAHNTATTTVPGFLSSADKTKLDGIASGATNTPLASTAPVTLGPPATGTGTAAARADHVHAMPTAMQVGAAAATHTHPDLVVGPASSAKGNIPFFDSTDGKKIKDSGQSINALVALAIAGTSKNIVSKITFSIPSNTLSLDGSTKEVAKVVVGGSPDDVQHLVIASTKFTAARSAPPQGSYPSVVLTVNGVERSASAIEKMVSMFTLATKGKGKSTEYKLQGRVDGAGSVQLDALGCFLAVIEFTGVQQ
ncbi:MAG: hypothetical protein FD153_1725 [Rhodospirillaceae bacterium]|nr:MAG: hypothetical protein FD153_1725 [Rhodospirillaceae bacterium]